MGTGDRGQAAWPEVAWWPLPGQPGKALALSPEQGVRKEVSHWLSACLDPHRGAQRSHFETRGAVVGIKKKNVNLTEDSLVRVFLLYKSLRD